MAFYKKSSFTKIIIHVYCMSNRSENWAKKIESKRRGLPHGRILNGADIHQEVIERPSQLAEYSMPFAESNLLVFPPIKVL